MSLPQVVVVGRPNVGKSTLLNRIIGRREAIVEEKPGVTRDRKEVLADWNGRDFMLVDTGGWLTGGSQMDRKVSMQAEAAMAGADVLLLVVDATVGVTEEDAHIVKRARAADVPIVLVGNKTDDNRGADQVWDLVSLGLGEPFSISALHGRGIGDLLDAVVEKFPEPEPEPEERIFSIVIVGRPNVGKSTLFNQLIGEERSIVHDMSGTTRDTVDTVVELPNGKVRFLDTAGMRRRSRIDEDTEYYSVMRALKSVDTADIALLVIDSTEGVTHQDQRVAERVDAAGCPIVLVLNKWDLVDTEQRLNLATQIERRLGFLPDVPLHRTTATTGKGVDQLLPSMLGAIDSYQLRIPTKKVNDALRKAQMEHPAPGGAKVLYATQGATDPPTFTLFTNRPLHESYIRYLERSLRETFDLAGTPIKLRVRRRSE